MYFELVGDVSRVQEIAAGREIRESPRLRRLYGRGRWRKLKGVGTVRLENGTMLRAEVHWYEAHGIGRREMKLKRFLP